MQETRIVLVALMNAPTTIKQSIPPQIYHCLHDNNNSTLDHLQKNHEGISKAYSSVIEHHPQSQEL